MELNIHQNSKVEKLQQSRIKTCKLKHKKHAKGEKKAVKVMAKLKFLNDNFSNDKNYLKF